MPKRRKQDTTSSESSDDEVIKFYSKDEPYYEFSNFYLADIEYKGKIYPSSEHLYQALKFLGPKASKRSKEYAREIRKVNTPNKARILANQKTGGGYQWRTDLNPIIEEYQDVKMRKDWDDIRDDIMRKVILYKFEQNRKLRKLLLSTGDAVIQENSPRDYYWGIGKDGSGENMLGIILMETRDILRNV